MKKWILPIFTLVLALGIGNAADGKAMTTQEKLQKEAANKAAYEASFEKPMKLMEYDDIDIDLTLPASGSLACENGNTMDFTFTDGVLTISGTGDKLTEENKHYFSSRNDITKVVFTNDCTMTNLYEIFEYCHNLTEVENIPATVTVLDRAFVSTGLTSVPKLPENLESMSYTFSRCEGITEVDWSALPKTVKDFSGAFVGTSLTSATIVMNNLSLTSIIDYAYCFSNCESLKTVTVDATGLNAEGRLWLQGICCECPSLESFELINIPETNLYPGSYSSSDMFNECSSLKSVKSEGYFYFSVDHTFNNCTQLSVLETKGFTDLYSEDALEYAFYNCSSLSGDYYISFSSASELYDYADNLASPDLKDYITYSFAGCNANTNFYLGFQALVDYWNQLKLTPESKSDANFYYWKEGDHYDPSTSKPTITPTPGGTSVTPNINTPVIPTSSPDTTVKTDTKKSISTLKLTKYKKGSKSITGKTIAKATVKISIGKKTYKVKSNSKGKFTVKLKAKLKKKDSIKMTVSKSGYTSKSKTFKIK